jgi:putative endonuclease
VNARAELGRSGEDVAADMLVRAGLEIVERNFRCSSGEIDIVARRGRLIVFCEVKTRRSARWGDPSEAVNGPKRHRLRRLAAEWMELRRPRTAEVRFDVVSVIVRKGKLVAHHIPDAF